MTPGTANREDTDFRVSCAVATSSSPRNAPEMAKTSSSEQDGKQTPSLCHPWRSAGAAALRETLARCDPDLGILSHPAERHAGRRPLGSRSCSDGEVFADFDPVFGELDPQACSDDGVFAKHRCERTGRYAAK